MAERTKLVVTGVPEHFNLPWILAIEDGAFASAGIDLEWIDEPGGTGAMSSALYHGDVDMALLLTEGALTSILTGNQCTIHSTYVDSPLVWGVFAGSGSEKDAQGLEDSPFAISRFYSGSHLMAFVYADQHGKKVSQDDFNPVGGIDGAREALKTTPDQRFLWEKFITLPFVRNGEFKLVDEIASPWPSFVAVVRNEIKDEKRVAINRAMEIVRDYAFNLQYSGEEGAELIAHIYEMSLESATNWLNDVRFSVNGKVDMDVLKKVTSTLHELSILERVPTDKELSDIVAE
ncbi:hypothetical protein [Sanyastnella coralliicola]|uniref:hypothetical protein n=1 Tax=Sanyastnella coralliicola TaxID=3069118 RepID=UPI0027B91ED6|nr:hypothetical protein [Longitalea sp. SCSIO 12813]